MNIERGPCDADALNLVLLFLKRRGLKIVRHVDFPKHKNVFVTDGREQFRFQVYNKGGVTANGLGGGTTAGLLRQFVNVIGTKPGKGVGRATDAEEPARKSVRERLASLEAAVSELRKAIETP